MIQVGPLLSFVVCRYGMCACNMEPKTFFLDTVLLSSQPLIGVVIVGASSTSVMSYVVSIPLMVAVVVTCII